MSSILSILVHDCCLDTSVVCFVGSLASRLLPCVFGGCSFCVLRSCVCLTHSLLL